MKNFLKILIILFLSAALITIIHSCKKSTAPSVTTANISGINETGAVCGGTVTNNGGEDVNSRGVCWQTDQNPTLGTSKTSDGKGNGTFASNITGLTAGTTYHVRAYATNSVGTSYGNDVKFTTPCLAPSSPVVGTITQTTCAVATGSVELSGLPSTGTWTLTRAPGGTTATGTGTSTTISGLSAGTFTFTVTNSLGCVSEASGNILINAQPALPSAPEVGTITQPTCVLATGSVVLNGLPSTGTWTLTRTPGGTTTSGTGTNTTASGLSAGTYTFTMTDASGCVSTASGNVVINTPAAAPSAPIVGTITQPTCAVATGSVALSGLPSSGSWTLTRTPGGTTTTGSGSNTTVSGIATGTYTFTVTNSSGCVSSASGNVVINAQSQSPSAPVVGTITQPTCAIPSGSVVLSGLPSTGTWTLTRTPGGISITGTGTSTTASALAAGTYTFTVTNVTGCVSAASGNVVINTQPASPSVPVVGTITQPTCAIATGSVALSGLPSTGTWTLTRTPGGTTTTGTGANTTISGLATGTYTFAVTNTSGCVSAASGNVVIGVPVSPSALTTAATNISSTTATLNGSVNGNGSSTEVSFEYGTTTSYGIPVTAAQSPVTGSSFVNASITNLASNTLYHYRVTTVNCGGTIAGGDMTFFTTSLVIGDTYQGGKVAYIFQSYDPGYVIGQTHGIIAAPSDLPNSFTGCWGTAISGALGAGIGAGKQNTIDVVTGCTTSGIAARLCYDLSLNGYDDWYLPSRSELQKLYANSAVIGNFNSTGHYWSSTRESSSSSRYYEVSFVDGSFCSTCYDSGDTYSVRAIRYF